MAKRYRADVFDTLVVDPIDEALDILTDRFEQEQERWDAYLEWFYHKAWSRQDIADEKRAIIEELGLGPILLRNSPTPAPNPNYEALLELQNAIPHAVFVVKAASFDEDDEATAETP